MTEIICAIIRILTIRTEEGATQSQLLNVLRRGMFGAAALEIGCMAVVIHVLDMSWELFFCLVIGISAGIGISVWSECFTSSAYFPTHRIANSGIFGLGDVCYVDLRAWGSSYFEDLSLPGGSIRYVVKCCYLRWEGKTKRRVEVQCELSETRFFWDAFSVYAYGMVFQLTDKMILVDKRFCDGYPGVLQLVD